MIKRCFLSGIGGSGMSALANLLLAQGWQVSGSDRSHDRGETTEKFSALQAQGIVLFPQNGSGLHIGTDCLIVSSAVEETTPDVQAARTLNIPVRKRAEVLAELFNKSPVSIGVAGTSGKSTITAMIGWILHAAGQRPTIMNGASMRNFSKPSTMKLSGLGNSVIDVGEAFVAEIDESDGSIVLFHPMISVISNITVDHKPIATLRQLFAEFIQNNQNICILNLDDPESILLKEIFTGKPALYFSLFKTAADIYASEITPMGEGVYFTLQGADIPPTLVKLQIPGRHNVANALAALAASHATGIETSIAVAALADFQGIGRRYEKIGTMRGITVIDDFAHNPEKIAATLQTLHEQPGRVLAIFQPHGFGPTKLMRAELVAMFVRELQDNDILLMPEIFYAGGTAVKDISSETIVADVNAQRKQARFFKSRADIIKFLAMEAGRGDRIVMMGARDDTLPEFAQDILVALQ